MNLNYSNISAGMGSKVNQQILKAFKLTFVISYIDI